MQGVHQPTVWKGPTTLLSSESALPLVGSSPGVATGDSCSGKITFPLGACSGSLAKHEESLA